MLTVHRILDHVYKLFVIPPESVNRYQNKFKNVYGVIKVGRQGVVVQCFKQVRGSNWRDAVKNLLQSNCKLMNVECSTEQRK